MRPVLAAPVAVALFNKNLLVIEANIDPVSETLISKTQVCMLIIQMTGIITEFELLFDSARPVFIYVKRELNGVPELKISISRSKTTSIIICNNCKHHKETRCSPVRPLSWRCFVQSCRSTRLQNHSSYYRSVNFDKAIPTSLENFVRVVKVLRKRIFVNQLFSFFCFFHRTEDNLSFNDRSETRLLE